jgi:SAM-dependent methyltransferase
MATSYRDEFDTSEAVQFYESMEYSEFSYASILWDIEKNLLQRELQRLRATKARIDYLDFACGTGRIMSYIGPQVQTVTGIDISARMLAVARERVTSAHLVCRDITDEAEGPEGKYDLITSFRFLLNAEPVLRAAALKAMAKRLRDRNSRLIVNNHGNPLSHKLIAWPAYKLRKMIYQEKWSNYLQTRTVRKLLHQAGLEMVATHGYGQLSAKALFVLRHSVVKAIECRLADFPLIGKLGSSQMYVARLRCT